MTATGLAAERSLATGLAVPGRRRPPPWPLLGASGAVAAVLLAPLAFLLIEASGAGVGTIAHLVWRPLTTSLLWNTLRLTVVVTALCAVIGTLTAWCVECTDLPGRRLWAVLVVVPFAIPDFVVSFAWSSISTWVQGFQGAVLVMTLAVYPLVHLPVAASLRSADPGLEEAARSLGLGRVRTFLRVTVGQARGAILGGCVLVALVILAEYGAFEILGYQTFTTEVFTEFQVSFNVPTACALSLVLVLLSCLILGGEVPAWGRGRAQRTGALAQRAARRQRLGRATLPVEAALAVLVALALGVPAGASLYWMLAGGVPTLSGVSILDAGWHTALYSGTAAALATLLALPVALLAVRHAGRGGRLLERSTYLVLAMPGLVIALAISYFAERYANGFGYQSAALLVAAYALLFFPLALVGVRASVAHAPVALEEAARSLGLSPPAVFLRVTLPLIGPGLAAAFCLVFLACATELTATLVLVPTGVQTLATQFWAYQQNLAYGQAAPFAVVIIAIAAVPSYVLARYFDRLPGRRGAAR
ncbi:MAG: ABC transporter permease [Candidatus Dormibacteria bacterium]